MNFDDLDKKMRAYEQSLDQILLPELYLAARPAPRSPCSWAGRRCSTAG